MAIKVKYIFIFALFIFGFSHLALAELAGVGPNDGTNGFPKWYQDENGTVLELCLDQEKCEFDPRIIGNTFSQQIGFGKQAFYWSASAEMTVGLGGAGKAKLEMGLIASFDGAPASGKQITFIQIAVGPIDNLLPGGHYTVIHPFGILEGLVADNLGKIPIQRRDIGCAVAPCDFAAPLSADIGPFLRWDSGAPTGFIGNPEISHKIAGSPYGTNFFRLEGPKAGGVGTDFKETDLFRVQGKLFTGTGVPTPLTVKRSTYSRPILRQVEVSATSAPNASLQVSGTGLATTAMVGDGEGNFFARIPLVNPASLPRSVKVTASRPPNKKVEVDSPLVDMVTITTAEFNASTSILTIEASSSDQLVPPLLISPGFGNLVAGRLVVSGMKVPPTEVTVISSHGGMDTAQVIVKANIKPIARNDTGFTKKNNPVIHNILPNDTAIQGSLDPSGVAIVTGPANGVALIDPATGAVTYTPNTDFFGKDSFTYTVMDTVGSVSNVATMRITVIDREVLTVRQAIFMPRYRRWLISGTSLITPGRLAGNVITIHLGPDTTGLVIGTAKVNIYGGWTFSKLYSRVEPGGSTAFSVMSSLGTTVLNFPITIR